jgi:hypothetical protein
MSIIRDTTIFHVPKPDKPQETIKKEDNVIQYSQVDKKPTSKRRGNS